MGGQNRTINNRAIRINPVVVRNVRYDTLVGAQSSVWPSKTIAHSIGKIDAPETRATR